MFDVSVTNGAPPCTLAAIRGVMGAVRPLSSTARSTGAAGAAGAVVSRRCTQPSRGGRPRSAVARPRRCSPRCRGARARRRPARASPVLPARWEHASAPHVGRSLAGRVQRGRLVDAPIPHRDTPLRCLLLDVSSGSNVSGVPLPLPPAPHQRPCEGMPRALCEERTGPVRAHGTRRAHTHSAGPPVEALQALVAPYARLYRIASTAWTRDAIGPASLSQRIGSLLGILQGRSQVFHGGAPMGDAQPPETDTARVTLCERSATEERSLIS